MGDSSIAYYARSGLVGRSGADHSIRLAFISGPMGADSIDLLVLANIKDILIVATPYHLITSRAQSSGSRPAQLRLPRGPDDLAATPERPLFARKQPLGPSSPTVGFGSKADVGSLVGMRPDFLSFAQRVPVWNGYRSSSPEKIAEVVAPVCPMYPVRHVVSWAIWSGFFPR